jgi:hypothetical protein
MYIKTFCPHCGEANLHDIIVNYQKTSEISKNGVIAHLNVAEVKVRETVAEDTLMKSILKTLIEHEKLHLGKEELTYVLKNIFGLTRELANEIAEKILSENKVLKSPTLNLTRELFKKE